MGSETCVKPIARLFELAAQRAHRQLAQGRLCRRIPQNRQ